MKRYVLDTNVIIDIFERRYPPDLFPDVERCLEGLASDRRLLIPEDVRAELGKISVGGIWIDKFEGLVVEIDESIECELALVMRRCPSIIDPMSTRNADAADPVVVATAKAHGATVVTEERRSSSPKRTKVPNACDIVGVRCVRLLEFFREVLLKT